jgi:hypothetical protein
VDELRAAPQWCREKIVIQHLSVRPLRLGREFAAKALAHGKPGAFARAGKPFV